MVLEFRGAKKMRTLKWVRNCIGITEVSSGGNPWEFTCEYESKKDFRDSLFRKLLMLEFRVEECPLLVKDLLDEIRKNRKRHLFGR